MTAKEYLNQATHLDALIHCRLREIDYWRDLSIRSVHRIHGMALQHFSVPN